MIIKVWFSSDKPKISDSYVTLEGRLVLVEPMGDRIKATIAMSNGQNEVICNYLTTFE